MKIILIGFMGSGKSTVGQCLAQLQGHRFYETDVIGLQSSDRLSIAEIFEKDGEPAWRACELVACRQLSPIAHGVIATGGGMVQSAPCMDHLRATGGKVVYLSASFDMLRTRVTADRENARPLFMDIEKARALYDRRIALYANYADLTVDVTDKKPEEIARAIIQLIMEKR